MRISSVLAALLLLAVPLLSHRSGVAADPHRAPGAAAPQALERSLAGLDAELDGVFTRGGLTADAAAARARATSPSVRAAFARAGAAAARVGSAKVARLPALTVSAGYTRLSDVDSPGFALGGTAIELPVLRDSYQSGAELRVPLSDHLVRFPHQTQAAEQGARAAGLGAAAATFDAALEARLAYHEWVRARLQVVVAEQRVAQVQATLAQIQVRAAAEDASRADVLRLEARAAEAAQQVFALRSVADQRELALRRVIGARDDEPLAIGDDIRRAVGDEVPGDPESWVAHARLSRPEIEAYDARITAAGASRKAIASTRLPRLDGFARLDYDNPNQRVFPAQERFDLTWAAGVRVSWSLDGAIAAKPAMAEQDAEVARLTAERAALADQLELQVMSAARAVTVARSAHASADEALAAAEESYRVRRALFAAGRTTTIEIIDAETELTRARIAALDARIDLRIGLARLRHAVGIDR